MLRTCFSFRRSGLSTVQWLNSSVFAAMTLVGCFSLAEQPLARSDGLSKVSTTALRGSTDIEREVELFTAMRTGEATVELSALSSRTVWLKVTNQTDSTLRIALPQSFAGVPVLAQLGGPLGGGGNGAGLPGLGLPGGGNNLLGLGNAGGGNVLGGNAQGAGGAGQGLGGGFNNGGNGIGNQPGLGNQIGNQFGNQFGNGAAGRGIFRVAPGRVGKVPAQTVCLEHGKPEPTARMKYRIVPLDDFTRGDARISKLCQLLAEKRVTQNVAQAVAWHVANGLSWDQLAGKDRTRSKVTGNEKFFTSEELQLALQVTQIIESPPDYAHHPQ